MSGSHSIATERQRQMAVEGWTTSHDDTHRNGELPRAAALYAHHAAQPDHVRALYPPGQPPEGWPWDPCWWKPRDPRSDLVRAGALIAAEIDRLDRLPNDRA